jgi:phosphatidylglycerophosphate synthase
MKYSYNIVEKSFHSQEPWINVFLLKYITVPLVYLMVNFTKITPNIVSLLSILFGIYSAYLYFTGDVIMAGAMYFVSYIFDATDGKVARITKTGKPYGAWLDICIDRINLVLISTAIAYNYYTLTSDVTIVFLNCFFLGFAFIGWESRYNIDYFKLKSNTSDTIFESNSKYVKWCKKKGVIKAPISLPEIFLFYLVLAPNLKIELSTLIIITIFLVLRIILQQKFWINVVKN